MTLQTILGQKLEQTQKFLEDGTRIPVTRIWVKGNVVTNVRSMDKHNYSAVQLGFGKRSKATKSLIGNVKGASLEQAPKFLKEVRTDEVLDLGTVINPIEVLAEGDIIDITGVSKGKGYAGVVKRHGFAGGPRTHGQSDRERAPGSIGQTTTPGRVYRGKRMAGRMGNENVTIKNLVVVGVTEDEVWVKGLIPGSLNSMVIVRKVGASKKFVPLFKLQKETDEKGDSRPSSPDDVQTVDTQPESQSPSSLNETRPIETEGKTLESEQPILDSSEGGQAPVSSETSSNESEQVGVGSSESEQAADSSKGKEEVKEIKEEKKGEVENAG